MVITYKTLFIMTFSFTVSGYLLIRSPFFALTDPYQIVISMYYFIE